MCDGGTMYKVESYEMCSDLRSRAVCRHIRRLLADSSHQSPTLELDLRAACDCSYLARITRTCFSPRGVCISIRFAHRESGDTHIEIAQSAVCQKWAGPTALPRLNVFGHVEMYSVFLNVYP